MNKDARQDALRALEVVPRYRTVARVAHFRRCQVMVLLTANARDQHTLALLRCRGATTVSRALDIIAPTGIFWMRAAER